MNPLDLFSSPGAWPVLVLVPLTWLSARAADRRRWRQLTAKAGARAAAVVDLSAGERPRARLRRGLAAAAVAAAAIAVMQPAFGEGWRRVEQRGVDLVVCLDVSRSMLARDLPPSRLLAAHRELRALAEHVRGDRLGLVVFAGEARLAVPLTRDTAAFADLVDAADPLSVTRGGTDLGIALETALAALSAGAVGSGSSSGEHEVVLLLTDGEDPGGRGQRVAEECARRGIEVFTVGLGSPRGSKIPLPAEGPVPAPGFLRDRDGNEVISALDATSLRAIAEISGGSYLHADATPLPLVAVYERHIAPMARKSYEAALQRERANRFQWPLLAAFLLWILRSCTSDRQASSPRCSA